MKTTFEEYQKSVRNLDAALNAHQQILRRLSLENPGHSWSESIGDNFRLTKNALWSACEVPTKLVQEFDFGKVQESVYDFDFESE